MNTISDAEIHQIVQRVLMEVTGSGQKTAAPEPSSMPEMKAAEKPAQTQDKKVVAIGADHGGFDMKEILKTTLTELGYDVRDAGAYNKGTVDYPDFAHEVARLVSVGKAWRGIMIDGAGIGSCIVANKVPGIRAGMAYDISSAISSREHNDTNVLTLGAGKMGANLAKQIVTTWLSTEFGGGRHVARIDKISAVEKQYQK